MLLVNGKIYSVSIDDKRIRGSAVAVSGGKIIAVGNDDEIKPYIGDNTRVFDCEGNTILPGLCDAHCHPSFAASFLVACDLYTVRAEGSDSCDDVIEKYKNRIRQYISEHPDEKIIRGTGWNLAYFNGSGGEFRLPDRHDLDQISTEKPILLESYCQHNLWANTKALEIAGIDENTKTPQSGTVRRDADGYPTGLFQEFSAINLVKEAIPEYDYSVEKYKTTILTYQKTLANIYGVTLANDCLQTFNAIEAYKQLAEEGLLTMRFRGVYPVDSDKAEEMFQEALDRKGKDNAGDCYGINTIKIFIEGEMCMCEPWEKEITTVLGLPEDYCSQAFWTEEKAGEYIKKALASGFQVHIHAMGDRSVKQAVNALEYAQKEVPGDHRCAIAHLMAVKPEDIEKIGELKTICAVQPRWAVYDTDVEDFYTPYFGRERALRFYPIKQLIDAGGVTVFGTDFPVTPPPNPYHEIQCAITREVFKDAPDYDRFKGRALGPDGNERRDCTSLDEAIKSLTINGAYFNYLEDITGSIEIGKSADLVVLDNDIENMPVDEIYKIKARATFFKGRQVYSDCESGFPGQKGVVEDTGTH